MPERNTEQAMMISNIWLRPGSGAPGAAPAASGCKPLFVSTLWLDTIAETLATGVATTDGGTPTWSAGALTTVGGTSPISIPAEDIPSTAALYTYTLTGTVMAWTGTPLVATDSPAVGTGGLGYQLFSFYYTRRAVIVTDGPALSTGDKVHLRFPHIKGVAGSAADGVNVILAIQDGGLGDGWNYSLTDGSLLLGSSDSIAAYFGAVPSVELTDNGDGSVELTLTWTAAGDVAAGWLLGVSPYSAADQASKGIEFDTAEVIVSDTSPHGGSVSGGYGLVVADPAVGSHRAALPFVLSVTAAKPESNGTVIEIVGTTGGQAGDLVVRLETVNGELRLTASEDGGTTTLQATVPADSWLTTAAAPVALRMTGDEVVLFVDGRAATGLPLAAAPSGIDSYSVAARGDGASAVSMAIEEVAEANGLSTVSDVLRVMTTAERESLPSELAGRLYAEVD